MAVQGQPLGAQHVEDWQHGRPPHVVGRRPALVGKAEQQHSTAGHRAASFPDQLDEAPRHVERQVFVQTPGPRDEPRLVAGGNRARDQDVGVLRQAASAHESGPRQIGPWVVDIRRADQLERIEREPLGEQRDLVAERVDQIGVAVVDELDRLGGLQGRHRDHAGREPREEGRRSLATLDVETADHLR